MGSVSDFSISIVKNIPQNKINIVVCRKKAKKSMETQLTKSDIQLVKRRT